MSGGHWGYRTQEFLEMGQNVAELYQVISMIEHELDWGISGDTCFDCAKLRVVEALLDYFDGEVATAIIVGSAREHNQCPRCKERAS